MVKEFKDLTQEDVEKTKAVFSAFNLLGLKDEDIEKIAFIVKTYDNLVAKVDELQNELDNIHRTQNMNNFEDYRGMFNNGK